MPYSITESVPGEKPIKQDHSINSHSVKANSVQYTRNTIQVPFKYSVRGPATIRGRNAPYKVTKA